MFNTNAPSLADIAAVTGSDNTDAFGGNSGWWILIILFAIFGWGGNGFGNNNGTRCATTTDLQNGFDTQSIINKLNGVNNGLCDGFYAMNTSLLNGFNSAQAATTQADFDLQQAINTVDVNAMQNLNSLSTQLASCCCENRQGQAQISYDMATQACQTRQAIADGIRDITDNQNANYRALHDEIVANRIEDKNAQISALKDQLAQANLSASQSAQNQYLIDQLRPAAVPSFSVPNPYASYGYGCYCNSAA